MITFYVTNSGFHQPGRVRWTRVHRQDTTASFDGRARFFVRLLEIFSGLVVVLVVAAIDDRRILIVDPRRGDLLYRPLQRVVFIEDLLTSQGNNFLIAQVGRVVVLRLIAWWCHLFARSIYA